MQHLEGAGPSLADRLLIVPDAHLRVDALRFQVEMYELFHRTTVGRVGHMLGTPTVLVGVFAATLAVHPVLGTAVVAACGLGMMLNTLRLDRAAAIAAAPATIVLAAIAWVIAQTVASAWIGTAIALSGCAVQTLSHLAEDVPPPQSGADRFVPMREWLRTLTVREAARSTAQVIGVFFWLELWASLRILPLQLLHVAMRFGHRPELRRALDERIDVIVRGVDPRWREAGARR